MRLILKRTTISSFLISIRSTNLFINTLLVAVSALWNTSFHVGICSFSSFNRLFSYIPKEIDVYGLRREYAQELYRNLYNDRTLRDDYLSCYLTRHEKIESAFYKDRQGNVFESDNVYVVSQALGYSRIDTSITSYL